MIGKIVYIDPYRDGWESYTQKKQKGYRERRGLRPLGWGIVLRKHPAHGGWFFVYDFSRNDIFPYNYNNDLMLYDSNDKPHIIH